MVKGFNIAGGDAARAVADERGDGFYDAESERDLGDLGGAKFASACAACDGSGECVGGHTEC